MNRGYDIFIAHAGPDTARAETLYDLLEARTRVFLDSKVLQFGDPFDDLLAETQRGCRITVVLISAATSNAYYQKEEIAAAIDLARRAEHRVVPVFLDGQPQPEDVPYGLRRLHAATIMDDGDLAALADELVVLVKGEEALRAPAGEGDALAAFRLGLILREQGKQDEAMAWLEQAAGAGIAAAAATLGIDLRSGGQPDAAERWLRQAAEKDDAVGAHTLGLLLEDRGNIAEAIRWQFASAAAGDPAAAATLGRILLQPHRDAAVYWLREGAQRGDGMAVDELTRLGEP
jgi:TPR repeat protein